MKSLNQVDQYLRIGKHSETLLINQLSLSREENNKKVYKMGFGQSPFPIPTPISEALAAASTRKEYMSVQGFLPLRKAITEFHLYFENKNWQAEQIIVGAGSKILIYCVMAAFSKAHVLLPAPSWVSYEPQAKLAGHQVHWMETNFSEQWKLTPDRLDQHCKILRKPSSVDADLPIILVFNYPSNPTGQSYSREELANLAIIMKKHNVIVIADEIYSLLSYTKDYSTLEEFYPEGCIVSSGLSKWCGAGGWRMGFHHIPKSLGQAFFNAVISVASETYSCAPSPIQVAATVAYQSQSLAKEFLAKQIKLLQTIGNYCTDKLIEANVKVHPAQGGFYLFPEFNNFKEKLAMKGINDSEQLTAAIMQQTGVALLPGSAFGIAADNLTARLAFVDFDGAQIWDANISEPQFDKIKQGIAALCDWLESL